MSDMNFFKMSEGMQRQFAEATMADPRRPYLPLYVELADDTEGMANTLSAGLLIIREAKTIEELKVARETINLAYFKLKASIDKVDSQIKLLES